MLDMETEGSDYCNHDVLQTEALCRAYQVNLAAQQILAEVRVLNTRRKRHILGGLLMSACALLAGVAVTVLTIKEDENE